MTRIRAKIGRATELAVLRDAHWVNEALRRAGLAGRFGENDLASMLGHLDHDQQTSRTGRTGR